MECRRCQGVLVHEETWSVNNDFRQISYMRYVNFGNYQFMEKDMRRVDGSSASPFPAGA